MNAFAPFITARKEISARAAAAKASGRKVIGYMGPTVPVELFEAAGAVAVPITGDATAPTPLADRYMESLFDPRVRAVTQAILAGEWAMLDLIVLPRTSDSQQRLYYYLCELRRMGLPVPPAKLYDLLHTPAETSAAYNLERTRELKEEIENLTGAAMGDAALRAAIASSNARRTAIGKIVELRRFQPARISGADALDVFASWRLMDAQAYTAAIDAIITSTRQTSLHGARVVIAGSPWERRDFHDLLAELGAVVVGDFHAAGEIGIGGQIEETGDPLAAISAHYHRAIMSSRRFPFDPTAITRFAQAANAQAVVFYYDAEEEALTWDYPAQRRDLEAAGLRVIALMDQPREFQASALKAPLKRFLEAMEAEPAGAIRG